VSTVMNNTRGDKVFCIRRNQVPAVVTMPSRRSSTRPPRKVLSMPSRAGKQSKVVTLIARSDNSASDSSEKPGALSILRSSGDALSYGVRMTLVALFALLGWPHPTRDNDPGPSAARPSHWERVKLVSRLFLPSNGSKAAAAHADAAESAMEEEFARAA
jgi:hypothetical protein